MRILTIKYPESLLVALNLSFVALDQEAKIALAAKLYELGRLTSGQAIALAGILRIAFLLSCSRYGVATVVWDKQEMDTEFK